MERIESLGVSGELGQWAASGVHSVRALELPGLAGSGSNRPSSMGLEAPQNGDPAPHSWAAPLSLQAFTERARLLSELEIPCVFFVNNPPSSAVRCGAIRQIGRAEGGIELLGRDFRLSLLDREIDSIWLLNATNGAGSMVSVEVLRRSDRSPMLRMSGLDSGDGAAVWRDVMGNPSLSVG